VGKSHLITKVYFPRLIIPISSVLSGLVDFTMSFSILLAMMFYYQITPTFAALLLPLLILMALATALGAGLWLSALNVQYRDIRYAISLLGSIWVFCDASGVSKRLSARCVAILLWCKPNGGRCGGVSRSPVGERSAGLAFVHGFHNHNSFPSHYRYLLFPPNGKGVCRCCVNRSNDETEKSKWAGLIG